MERSIDVMIKVLSKQMGEQEKCFGEQEKRFKKQEKCFEELTRKVNEQDGARQEIQEHGRELSKMKEKWASKLHDN